jgi:hypothetical protein
LNTWFKRIFSIDEMKASVLVLSFLVALGIGLYEVIRHGDLPPNLTNVVIFLGASIAGVNAVGYFGSMVVNKGQQTIQMPMQSNMYGMSNMFGSTYPMNTLSTYGTVGTATNITPTIGTQTVAQATPTTQTGTRPQDRSI